MSYFVPLGEGDLLNLYWDPVVLLKGRPVEIHYTCNGAYHIKRGENMGVLVWHILSQSISSWLTVLHPLANMYGMHNLSPKAAGVSLLQSHNVLTTPGNQEADP